MTQFKSRGPRPSSPVVCLQPSRARAELHVTFPARCLLTPRINIASKLLVQTLRREHPLPVVQPPTASL